MKSCDEPLYRVLQAVGGGYYIYHYPTHKTVLSAFNQLDKEQAKIPDAIFAVGKFRADAYFARLEPLKIYHSREEVENDTHIPNNKGE